MTRVCKKCGEERPLETFQKHRGGRNGRVWTCKVCQAAEKKAWAQANPEKVRATRIWTHYRLTMDQYNELIANGCVVCGSHDKLHVDHDHSCCPTVRCCGKCVRGALCNRHNVALAMVNDSIEELESLANYLASRR